MISFIHYLFIPFVSLFVGRSVRRLCGLSAGWSVSHLFSLSISQLVIYLARNCCFLRFLSQICSDLLFSDIFVLRIWYDFVVFWHFWSRICLNFAVFWVCFFGQEFDTILLLFWDFFCHEFSQVFMFSGIRYMCVL